MILKVSWDNIDLTGLIPRQVELQLGYLLTYSMEQSPSWEANWFSASQEMSCIL
jgi:hypothetical protein